jgi:glycosyltransferase involved in cell wall biosynthesis
VTASSVNGSPAGVSVVLATYNGALYLEVQLQSLANQTHRPSELIISDDGSLDATLQIAEAFRRTAPFPVRVVRNETRLGYGGNFLRAARFATSEFVAFCDQDDVWSAEKLAAAIETLGRADAHLYVHAADLIDADGRTIGEFRQGRRALRAPLELGPWGVFYGFSMVFRRVLLDLVDPALRGPHTFEFESSLSHDLWIYFLANSLGRVFVDDRRLAGYRQHQANQTPHIGAGLRAWLRMSGAPAHPRLRRDEIARHRAALMSDLCGRATDARLRRAAGRAAEYWQAIARYEAERLSFYSDSEPRWVLRCLKLAWQGGYRSHRSGGLGWRLFLKDVLFLAMRRNRVGAWQT